jgi:tetratricopeptide (TPR) repeat protein
MKAASSVCLKRQSAAPLLLAALLFVTIGGFAAPACAQDDALDAPADVEHPADVAPDAAGTRLEDELIEPGDFDPEALMRPDVKEGSENGPPPQSAEESKQDKLSPHLDDLPLPTPADKPKLLAELYEKLGKARDEHDATPIIEAIEGLWRFSGSPTVDLLMSRAERFAKSEDLDLALKIADATVDIAPDQAEAWHLRAKVHYLKQDYGQALVDLRRTLDRDPKHFAAMNDLGVVLEATGAKKEALEVYRNALKINPFLSETKRAAEELGREIEGQDI